jgi:tRNA (guanine37-N1)-methyltransferase
MFAGILAESMLRRAVDNGALRIGYTNLRDFGHGRHQVVDDRPYGGGPGMLLKVEPMVAAVEAAIAKLDAELGADGWEREVILFSAGGEPYRQPLVKTLSGSRGMVLICGHYEGIDERVRALVVTRELCVGDYVLTGGEIPAMIVLDSIVRYLPGVLGEADSVCEESFENDLLEYPQYTRPAEFRGLKVPDVLLNGNHAEIRAWRLDQQLRKTRRVRPELLQKKEKPLE